jgi:hypothetical protein
MEFFAGFVFCGFRQGGEMLFEKGGGPANGGGFF